MDLKVISTGRVHPRIDSAVAGLLLELFPENLQRYEKPTVTQKPDEFYLGVSEMDGRPQLQFRKYAPDGRIIEHGKWRHEADQEYDRRRVPSVFPAAAVGAYERAIGARTVQQ